MAKHQDLTGKKFGRLTVLKEVGHPKPGQYLWECECSCSNHTHIIVDGHKLKNGNTKSCGCLHRELLQKRNKENAIHHIENERIYRIWRGMKERCYNKSHKKFEYYGGKGIKICQQWLDSYETFEKWSLNNGYNDDLTIERKDNSLDYCPENCCWATWTEQQNHKSNNKYLTYHNETKTLSQWCKELNLNYGRVKARINALHWSVEKAFEFDKNK